MKRGRLVTPIETDRAPDGSRLGAAPATAARVAVSAATACEIEYGCRLAAHLGAVEAARAEPTPENKRTRAKASNRLGYWREALVEAVGRAEYLRIDADLRANPLLLRAMATASDYLRPALIAATLEYARIAREHGLDTSLASVQLQRAARWAGIADALQYMMLSKGIHKDLLKLASIAGREARLDAATALHFGAAPSAGKGAPVIDLVARVRALAEAEHGLADAAPKTPGNSGGRQSRSSERSEESTAVGTRRGGGA